MDPDIFVPMPARRFMRNHRFLMTLLAVLAAVAVIGIGIGVYYYLQYTMLNNILKNPNVQVQKESEQLVGKVGKLMLLPTDEQPTIATVTDVSKLKNQEFFQNAQNGDKILIYLKAKKAILYRPSTNVIIDVAPVNITQQPTPESTGRVLPTPTSAAEFLQQSTATPTPVK